MPPVPNPVIKSLRLRKNRIVSMYVKGGMWVIETADRRKYRIQLPAPEPAGVPQWDVDIGEGFAHINEVPSGVINGINDTFTLVGVPPIGGLLLFKNGILQREAVGDYTLSGAIIVFESDAIPLTGDILLATY